MGLVLLVHWNAAEADERAAALRAAGHRVLVITTPRATTCVRCSASRWRPP